MQPTQKTYDALLEDGRIEWLGERPAPRGPHRVRVTVLEQPRPSPEEIQRVLNETCGTWATVRSLDEIDAEIEKMRAGWDRPWDNPNWKPEL